MARPKKSRMVCREPSFDSFGPNGIPSEGTIVLTVDEYEVMRLLDYEKLTQEECAAKMGIARTTVTDMYDQVRFKMADCFVNGKVLVIEGGNYRLCGKRAHCGGFKNCDFSEDVIEEIRVNPKGEKQMRIAVTYENGEIFQHFGHTEQFKFYDVEDNKIVSTQIADTNGQGHGALAGFLKSANADVLICGGIGGGAQNALTQTGIKLFGGCSGDADKAVESLLAGHLIFNPDVKCSHHNHEHEEGHTCGNHGCGNGSCH